MEKRNVVAVVGSGDDRDERSAADALLLGELLAREGWVVLSGGRDAGVMRAVNQGAKKVPGSLTVGILPSPSAAAAPGVDVAVVTDLRQGRNNVVVLSGDVVVACGIDGPGTASEVALALKNGRPLVLLGAGTDAVSFFRGISDHPFLLTSTPEEAVEEVRRLLGGEGDTSGYV
ncbi:MAG TPA: cytochrome [Verrucomicrobiae bacterium]|nr:cytochrome [Verrucomicrobiae bacterium]